MSCHFIVSVLRVTTGRPIHPDELYNALVDWNSKPLLEKSELDLSYLGLQPRHVEIIAAAAAKRDPSLSSIDLTSCGINGDDAIKIAKAVAIDEASPDTKNHTKKILLSYNRMEDTAVNVAEILFSNPGVEGKIASPWLEYVSFAHNNISVPGIMRIVQLAGKSKNVKVVDLHGNNLTEENIKITKRFIKTNPNIKFIFQVDSDTNDNQSKPAKPVDSLIRRVMSHI